MKTYVLDSFALLTLLCKEPGQDDVALALHEAATGKTRVLMSWVNVGEFIYIIERRWGREKVHQALGTLEATEVEIVEVGRELTLKAAALKAVHPLAYADAFAAALAMRENAILMTGDPEFEQLTAFVHIHWLPRKKTA